MITEVVVGVAKNDVECHSAIEFAEILPSVSTTLALGRAPPSEVPGSINWSASVSVFLPIVPSASPYSQAADVPNGLGRSP